MSDPVYDQFHAWRRQLDADLADIRRGYLQALIAELRQAADRIEQELRRRASAAEQHDARLYRQKGQS